jgi:hypothetical protein
VRELRHQLWAEQFGPVDLVPITNRYQQGRFNLKSDYKIKGMNNTITLEERIAKMTFASV